MSARPVQTCAGPTVGCHGAPILLRQQAQHRVPVVCHVCGNPRSLARYVVDALRDPQGRPMGAHVCRACDTLDAPAGGRRG